MDFTEGIVGLYVPVPYLSLSFYLYLLFLFLCECLSQTHISRIIPYHVCTNHVYFFSGRFLFFLLLAYIQKSCSMSLITADFCAYVRRLRGEFAQQFAVIFSVLGEVLSRWDTRVSSMQELTLVNPRELWCSSKWHVVGHILFVLSAGEVAG